MEGRRFNSRRNEQSRAPAHLVPRRSGNSQAAFAQLPGRYRPPTDLPPRRHPPEGPLPAAPGHPAFLHRHTQWGSLDVVLSPCGVGGTVIDLHAARSGRSVKAEFKIICAEIASLIGLDPATAPASPAHITTAPAPAKTSTAISAHELERITTPWSTRLFEDTKLREAFARELQLGSVPRLIL